MTANEALRELARRLAQIHHLRTREVIGSRRLAGRAVYVRYQLLYVVREMTGAADKVTAEAFCMDATVVNSYRSRTVRRLREQPELKAVADRVVEQLAGDADFIRTLRAAVAEANAALMLAAKSSWADSFHATRQRPDFIERRAARLQNYFDNGGRAALVQRNRAFTGPRKDSASRPLTRVQHTNQEHS